MGGRVLSERAASERAASGLLPTSVWGTVGSYLGVDESMALRLVVKEEPALDMAIVTMGAATCRVWRSGEPVELGDVVLRSGGGDPEEVQDLVLAGRWVMVVIDRSSVTGAIRRKMEKEQGAPIGIAVGTGGRALLFDVTTGEKVRTFEGRSSSTSDTTVEGVAISRDGRRLAIVRGTQVEIWCHAAGDFTKDRTLPVSGEPLRAAAFSPSGDKLAVAEYGRFAYGKIGGEGRSAIHIFDLPTSRSRLVWTPPANKFYAFDINSIAWGSSPNLLAIGAKAYLRLWDTMFGAAILINVDDDPEEEEEQKDDSGGGGGVVVDTEIKFLAQHKAAVTTVAFTPDGLRFAAADERDPGRIYDVTRGKLELVLSGSSWDVIFHSMAKILELAVGLHVEHQARTIYFSQDGKLVATLMAEGTSELYDAANGRHIATYTHKSGPEPRERLLPQWILSPRHDLPLTPGRIFARLVAFVLRKAPGFVVFVVVASIIPRILNLLGLTFFSFLVGRPQDDLPANEEL